MKIIDIFYFLAFVCGMASILLCLRIAYYIFRDGEVYFYERNLFILIIETILLLIAFPFLFILTIKFFIGEIDEE